MSGSSTMVWRRATAGMVSLLLVAGVTLARIDQAPQSSTTEGCPPGYHPWDAERAVERRIRSRLLPDGFDELMGELDADTPESGACISNKHPEEFAEISAMVAQRTARAAAPFATVAPGAFRNAVRETRRMSRSGARVPGSRGRWRPVGEGPLISDDERYNEVNGLGLAELNGRIDSLDYDERSGRLFALIGTGGVWMSNNLGKSWTSIGDSLPTQTNGAVAWSDARGGTLVVVSGEPLMGGNTYTGLGAFWSNDLGRTWHHARGVPDEAMGFQVAVDPTREREVYAATSQGLYRSRNAGRSFRNVKLPTGRCAGKTGYGRCQFANFVTDVVIKEPGGTGKAKGGEVLAAVGYRAGLAEFPNGRIHSPNNGLYTSASGRPGSFKRLDVSGDGVTPIGFAPQQNIGRVELGNATGPNQNHDYVYAIVEDAELFNGGVPSIDAPGDPGADDQALYNTSFNGIYVSADFGKSWTRMADTAEVAENPTTHSGLAVVGQALLFAPGVQAWYNMWIKPDPTRQTEDGVPTRLTFGLEEVWANRCEGSQNVAVQPPCAQSDGAGDFEVIGPYFADEACLLLETGLPVCPTAEGGVNTELTTHPDQHDALWVPRDDGGVSLVIGNDGGAYVQSVGPDGALSPNQWGRGNNDGFHTLLPYSAEVAKDGTVWFGMQDNGSGKITPEGRQFMTFGGDGFFVAVDPNNADVAYSETTFADMRVTTDGGQTWRGIPPPITNSKFSNPFVMDPTDADHLMTAGKEVVETLAGPDTEEGDWVEVFDLGNAKSEGEPANSMSALDVHGDAAYVGYCGVCDILNQDPQTHPFLNGLATNVGGKQPPERGSSQGWHHARAKGLPNRYITSIAIHPRDPETVYVALGGYANRQWVPPGSYLDRNKRLGRGHVFKSTNAGRTFENISGNLPNVSATWIEVHGRRLVLGTDTGAFVSGDLKGRRWAVLGRNLPSAPISTIRTHPGDPRTIVAATFGRGVYEYRFPR